MDGGAASRGTAAVHRRPLRHVHRARRGVRAVRVQGDQVGDPRSTAYAGDLRGPSRKPAGSTDSSISRASSATRGSGGPLPTRNGSSSINFGLSSRHSSTRSSPGGSARPTTSAPVRLWTEAVGFDRDRRTLSGPRPVRNSRVRPGRRCARPSGGPPWIGGRPGSASNAASRPTTGRRMPPRCRPARRRGSAPRRRATGS